MATQLFSRISSASISARRTTGSRCARASTSSGLSDLIAEDTTTTFAPVKFTALCPIATCTPLSRSPFDVGAVGLIGALHCVAEVQHHLGDALMPMPPMPTKNGPGRCRAAVSLSLPDSQCRGKPTVLRRPPPPSGPARPAGRRHQAGLRIWPHRPFFARFCDVAASAAISEASRPRRKIFLYQPDGAASPFQDARICELILIECMRQGTRIDGRPIAASSANRRSAGTRHNEMAHRNACRQIGKKRRDLGANRELSVDVAHTAQIFLAGLLGNRKPRAQCLIE